MYNVHMLYMNNTGKNVDHLGCVSTVQHINVEGCYVTGYPLPKMNQLRTVFNSRYFCEDERD